MASKITQTVEPTSAATQPAQILHAFIPKAIRKAYGIEDTANAAILNGGRVNITYLVRESNRVTLLQKLSSSLHPDVLLTMDMVSRHLAGAGWQAPLIIPAKDGKLYAKDNLGNLWRQQEFIAWDSVVPSVYSDELLVNAGKLLGKWHREVSRLPAELRHEAPNFHDTDYHAQKLESYQHQLPDTRSRLLAARLLQAYRGIHDLPEGTPQIIHADAKLDNMLYRDGQPFTFIDFDDMMVGSAWVDVGDLLRSMIGNRLAQQEEMSTRSLRKFVTSYRRAAGIDMTPAEALTTAMRAAHRISVELGIRYLCDIIDADYFLRDHEKYASRGDHHYARARLQFAVANTVKPLM